MTTRSASILVVRLGQPEADRLSTIAGGARLSVPSLLKNSGPLASRVGPDLAVALIFHFGGQRLYVPHAKPDRRTGPLGPVDLRRVVRLTRNGKSASHIARKLGCSDRTVYAKRRQARATGILE